MTQGERIRDGICVCVHLVHLIHKFYIAVDLSRHL